MSVFLSHNSQDKPMVERLAERLDDSGHEVWFDKWNLIPGIPWQEELEKAIEDADCVLVFLGTSLGPWHHEEIRLALENRIRSNQKVIPVLLPRATKPNEREIPRLLRRLNWVHFENLDDAESFYLLTCGISGTVPGRRSKTTKSSPPNQGISPVNLVINFANLFMLFDVHIDIYFDDSLAAKGTFKKGVYGRTLTTPGPHEVMVRAKRFPNKKYAVFFKHGGHFQIDIHYDRVSGKWKEKCTVAQIDT